MTKIAKYTLSQVIIIVKGHAGSLRLAGEALKTTEGKDCEVLAKVGEQALRAAQKLWAIDGIVSCSRPLEERPKAIEDAWWADRRGTTELHRAMYVLPVLALAVKAAGDIPDGNNFAGRVPWRWCQCLTDQTADDLMAWVLEHGKEVTR